MINVPQGTTTMTTSGESGGGGGGVAGVQSVNGQTGVVVLDAEDVGALPNDTVIPTALSQLAQDSTHRLVTDTEKTSWNSKQDNLVSGTNIKTINNESLLGSGNIDILPTFSIDSRGHLIVTY